MIPNVLPRISDELLGDAASNLATQHAAALLQRRNFLSTVGLAGLGAAAFLLSAAVTTVASSSHPPRRPSLTS